MTLPKYLIISLIILFSSCDNNPTAITEVDSHNRNNPIDTAYKVAQQRIVDPELLSFWTQFKEVVSKRKYEVFKKISLDSLKACDTTFSAQRFLSNCFFEVFDTILIEQFANNTSVDYFDNDTEREHFSQSQLDQFGLSDSIIVLRTVQIEKELTTDGAWTMSSNYVKTKKGYKFYGFHSYGGPICCR